MGMLSRARAAVKSGVRAFASYEATESKGKRRAPGSTLRSEDAELLSQPRRRLVFSTRDIRRNFAVAAWAVRQHLDYVSSFDFQATTGIDAVDERIEELMGWWQRPINFDAAGRHGRKRFMRILEASRTLDGDVGLMKLASGNVQGIEGDRVRTPGDVDLAGMGISPEEVVHGVVVNDAGFARGYCLHNRMKLMGGTGFEFDRIVSSSRMEWLGYYDRYDQVRGVSPLAPAINSYRDIYENFDYALAKMKIAQLFGLVFYRDALDSAGAIDGGDDSGEPTDGDEDDANDGKYTVDFGRGPIVLDLNPGDKAEFLENKTPSVEFQSFTNSMISVALKALDIPFSFYDVAQTTYSGGKMDWARYELSATSKREDLQNLLTKLTYWRLGLFIADDELVLPDKMTLPDISFDWVPTGVPPLLNPVDETTATNSQIAGGLDNPEDATRRNGGDVYRNIDKTARVLEYAKKKGVPLTWINQGGQGKNATDTPLKGTANANAK